MLRGSLKTVSLGALLLSFAAYAEPSAAPLVCADTACPQGSTLSIARGSQFAVLLSDISSHIEFSPATLRIRQARLASLEQKARKAGDQVALDRLNKTPAWIFALEDVLVGVCRRGEELSTIYVIDGPQFENDACFRPLAKSSLERSGDAWHLKGFTQVWRGKEPYALATSFTLKDRMLDGLQISHGLDASELHYEYRNGYLTGRMAEYQTIADKKLVRMKSDADPLATRTRYVYNKRGKLELTLTLHRDRIFDGAPSDAMFHSWKYDPKKAKAEGKASARRALTYKILGYDIQFRSEEYQLNAAEEKNLGTWEDPRIDLDALERRKDKPIVWQEAAVKLGVSPEWLAPRQEWLDQIARIRVLRHESAKRLGEEFGQEILRHLALTSQDAQLWQAALPDNSYDSYLLNAQKEVWAQVKLPQTDWRWLVKTLMTPDTRNHRKWAGIYAPLIFQAGVFGEEEQQTLALTMLKSEYPDVAEAALDAIVAHGKRPLLEEAFAFALKVNAHEALSKAIVHRIGELTPLGRGELLAVLRKESHARSDKALREIYLKVLRTVGSQKVDADISDLLAAARVEDAPSRLLGTQLLVEVLSMHKDLVAPELRRLLSDSNADVRLAAFIGLCSRWKIETDETLRDWLRPYVRTAPLSFAEQRQVMSELLRFMTDGQRPDSRIVFSFLLQDFLERKLVPDTDPSSHELRMRALAYTMEGGGLTKDPYWTELNETLKSDDGVKRLAAMEAVDEAARNGFVEVPVMISLMSEGLSDESDYVRMRVVGMTSNIFAKILLSDDFEAQWKHYEPELKILGDKALGDKSWGVQQSYVKRLVAANTHKIFHAFTASTLRQALRSPSKRLAIAALGETPLSVFPELSEDVLKVFRKMADSSDYADFSQLTYVNPQALVQLAEQVGLYDLLGSLSGRLELEEIAEMAMSFAPHLSPRAMLRLRLAHEADTDPRRREAMTNWIEQLAQHMQQGEGQH